MSDTQHTHNPRHDSARTHGDFNVVAEVLSIVSLIAYAYAAVAFVGDLFPDYAIAAAVGVLCTAAALIAYFVAERRSEVAMGRPAHCEPDSSEVQR